MSLTFVGYMIVIATALTLLFRPRLLWPLAVFLAPFQGAAAVLIGREPDQTGIAPCYVVIVIAVVREAVNEALQARARKYALSLILGEYRLLTLFVVWACFGAMVFPIILEARVPVLRYGALGLGGLERSIHNFRHTSYLVLGFLCVVSLTAACLREGPRFVGSMLRSLHASGWIATVFLLWHLAFMYWALPFPDDLIHNNPGAVHNKFGYMRPDLGTGLISVRRPSGTFTEPSYAAMFFVGFAGFLLARYLYASRRVLRLFEFLASIVILALMTSTTGWFAGGALLSILAIRVLWTVADENGRHRAFRVAIVVFVVGVVIVFPLALSKTLRESASTSFYWMVIDKVRNDSGDRGAIEARAARVFVDSYFLGVGLGGNEAFTLGGYLLSNTGIIGTFIALIFVFRLRSRTRAIVRSENRWFVAAAGVQSLRAFVSGVFLSGLIGVPILFQPVFWLSLALLIGILHLHDQVRSLAQAGTLTVWSPLWPEQNVATPARAMQPQ